MKYLNNPSVSPTRAALSFGLIVAAAAILSSCPLLPGKRASYSQGLVRVRTLAGLGREFGEPFGIAVRGSEVYVSDGERSRICNISANGSVSTFAEGFDTPSGVAFTSSGDLVVADSGSNTIKRIASDGSVSLAAGVPGRPGYADGDAASALFRGPIGIAVGRDDRIYVADTYNDRIRVIENGLVRTLAGGIRGFADGATPQFDSPLGLAVWHGDKLLVADSGNRRVRVVEPDGSAWTLAGSGEAGTADGRPLAAQFSYPTAVAVDASNAVFVADGNSIRAIGRRSFPMVETITKPRSGYRDGVAPGARLNRPSGLDFDESGNLLVADSDNQTIRIATDLDRGAEVTAEQKERLRFSADEFRALQPGRWPYDPPERTREIAGTLGEIRGVLKGGENDSVWFHNGLDIAGGYGETARFVRSETVLEPQAVENLGTSRELIRLPTMGYIHIRLGRDKDEQFFNDGPFIAELDAATRKPTHLRVPRGTHFKSGDAIGTLNALNHVHLIAGRSGAEMNALDALILPGVSDSIAPTIEQVRLVTQNAEVVETPVPVSRITVSGNTRVIVRAYDRVDGNSERRRLGVYKLGYQVLKDGQPLSGVNWTISFERMPPNDAVPFAYAPGSRSGYTPDTVFDYVVTNRVNGDEFSEDFLKAGDLPSGQYTLRAFAADFFGNTTTKDISFEVSK